MALYSLYEFVRHLGRSKGINKTTVYGLLFMIRSQGIRDLKTNMPHPLGNRLLRTVSNKILILKMSM